MDSTRGTLDKKDFLDAVVSSGEDEGPLDSR